MREQPTPSPSQEGNREMGKLLIWNFEWANFELVVPMDDNFKHWEPLKIDLYERSRR